jgi:tRNA A-37 threonylcarbamoyl transferase component Bud32
LRSKLIENYKPDLSELVQLTKTLLKAIKLLKENDLIHRDIKPDNAIKLKSPERPFVILDLGIAFKIHGTALTRNCILFKFHGEQIFAQKGPSVFSIEWYYLI